MIARCLLVCVLLISAASTSSAQTAQGIVFHDSNANGVLDAGEQGVAAVGVTNGQAVVQTDSDGRYSIKVTNDTIVSVIKPSGYRPPMDENGVSKFYYIHKPEGSPEGLKFPGVEPTGPLPDQVNFPLVVSEESSEFDVLFFGDPQPRDQQEIDYMAHDIVEDLIGSDAAFGVTLGDILFDDLDLFESFNRTVGKIGIPWYSVIGNHDINFATDEDRYSDETFERVYGPAYYAFNYGGIHFVVIDDVHWMTDGSRRFYRSGLSDEQLDFIENDLKQVPQNQLVVAMMHIPLVKSSTWLKPKRERLFRILETREHCVSLAGHTHHHEHVMIDETSGWKNKEPHHHIVNVTVSGSWWSGQPDESGIPHTMCADGTPNGYTIMHFDADKYHLEYRAARRPASYQMNLTAPDAVPHGTSAELFANVFNAMPDAVVTCEVGGRQLEMVKTVQTDPTYQTLLNRQEELLKAGELPWRKLARPLACPHLWMVKLPNDLPRGTYTMKVTAKNSNGQVFEGRRMFRVE